MRSYKLYETFDIVNQERYWWTQRDKKGRCYEIREKYYINDEFVKKSVFCLYCCDKFVGYYLSIFEAERAIHELWNKR